MLAWEKNTHPIVFSVHSEYNEEKIGRFYKMQYTVLGKTGLKIARLGFGGIPIKNTHPIVFSVHSEYNEEKIGRFYKMQYTVLGKTGLKIARLGFGGIPIQRIDAPQTKALMEQLRQAGVNFIDTARGYTVSEEFLGVGLEGIRQDFILATKSMSRKHVPHQRGYGQRY